MTTTFKTMGASLVALACITATTSYASPIKRLHGVVGQNLVNEANVHDTAGYSLYLSGMAVTPDDRAVSISPGSTFYQLPEVFEGFQASLVHRHSGFGVAVASQSADIVESASEATESFKPSYTAVSLVKDFAITKYLSGHLGIVGRLSAGMAKPKIKVVTVPGEAEQATLKPKNLGIYGASIRAEYGFSNTNLLIHSHSKAPGFLVYMGYGINHFSKQSLTATYNGSTISYKTANSYLDFGFSVTMF